MTELTIRRVVVACDVSCDVRLTMNAAAELAQRLGAAVHGVFLEDGGLRRLTELPFGRQVSLSAADIAEPLMSGLELANMLEAFGTAARQALAAAADKRRLDWSFALAQDVLEPLGPGDLLVIEASARAFSGAWRPHSRWEGREQELGDVVLFRRGGTEGSGIVLALSGDETLDQRLLSAVLTLGDPAEEIVIAPLEGGSSAQGATTRALDRLQSLGRRARIGALSLQDAEWLQGPGAPHPRLVAIASRGGQPELARAVFAKTGADVLLLR
ncbi:MAG TPA: hypothetical protein VN832_07325 [Stellaceae bacterium]|nr:hypothetical protein [Stellaceae bacterium]